MRRGFRGRNPADEDFRRAERAAAKQGDVASLERLAVAASRIGRWDVVERVEQHLRGMADWRYMEIRSDVDARQNAALLREWREIQGALRRMPSVPRQSNPFEFWPAVAGGVVAGLATEIVAKPIARELRGGRLVGDEGRRANPGSDEEMRELERAGQGGDLRALERRAYGAARVNDVETVREIEHRLYAAMQAVEPWYGDQPMPPHAEHAAWGRVSNLLNRMLQDRPWGRHRDMNPASLLLIGNAPRGRRNPSEDERLRALQRRAEWDPIARDKLAREIQRYEGAVSFSGMQARPERSRRAREIRVASSGDQKAARGIDRGTWSVTAMLPGSLLRPFAGQRDWRSGWSVTHSETGLTLSFHRKQKDALATVRLLEGSGFPFRGNLGAWTPDEREFAWRLRAAAEGREITAREIEQARRAGEQENPGRRRAPNPLPVGAASLLLVGNPDRRRNARQNARGYRGHSLDEPARRANYRDSSGGEFTMKLPAERVKGTISLAEARKRWKGQVDLGVAGFRDFHGKNVEVNDEVILYDDGRPDVQVAWVAGISPEVTYGGSPTDVPSGSVKDEALWVHATGETDDGKPTGKPTYLIGLVPQKGPRNVKSPVTRDFMLIGNMVAKKGWLRR